MYPMTSPWSLRRKCANCSTRNEPPPLGCECSPGVGVAATRSARGGTHMVRENGPPRLGDESAHVVRGVAPAYQSGDHPGAVRPAMALGFLTELTRHEGHED